MPFTPTHTLAAVPIARLWSRPGTFSALVIGSMVPDWPLYVPYGPSYTLLHSITGAFVAGVPLGFALVLLYRTWLRRPLFELLPVALQSRLAGYLDDDGTALPRLAAILMAVVLGAESHVVWDAFTHRGAWGVALVPSLRETLLQVGGVDIPGYIVLQHGCTVVGLPLALLLFATWFRRAPQHAVPVRMIGVAARRIWRALLIGVPAAGMLIMSIEVAVAVSINDTLRVLYFGVTRTGLALLLLLAGYGLWFALLGRQRRAALPAEG